MSSVGNSKARHRRRSAKLYPSPAGEDTRSLASCLCWWIDGPNSTPCPNHHPRAYTTWGSQHRGSYGMQS